MKKYSKFYHYIQPTSQQCGFDYRDVKSFQKYLNSHYSELINDLIKLYPTHQNIITSRLYVSDATYSELFGRKYQFGQLAEKFNLEKYYDIKSFCILWKSYDEYLKRISKYNIKIQYTEEEFKKLKQLFEKYTKQNNGYILYVYDDITQEQVLTKLQQVYIN